MRFRPEQHLRRPGDFRPLREQGRRIDCGAFTLWWRVREPATAAPTRVGFVAYSAQVGGAVARARANRPRLLLADEPTGNLDPGTSQSVFEALQRLVKDTGVAALIATHNMELAGHMDRVFALKDGHLEERPAESHAY